MKKKELAYEKIKEDIFCRNFLPGERLNIAALSNRYGMSTIPIREALVLLESDMLVMNVPYKGFVVTRVKFDEFMEFSIIRNHMECLALRYGIAYLTDESLEKIKELQRQLINLYHSGNYSEYVIVNRKFYKSLYDFAPCKTLMMTIDNYTQKAFHNRSLLLICPSRIAESISEHELLIESIENSEMERAANIMFSHRLKTLYTLLCNMRHDLMKPSYKEEPSLNSFFDDVELDDRMTITGKVEYWKFIVEKLSSDGLE